MTIYHVAIRSLAQFIWREGDIIQSLEDGPSSQLGIELHQYVQSKQDIHYQSEAPMIYEYQLNPSTTFLLRGRADGIGIYDHLPMIDEIKTTTQEEVTPRDSHQAQAMLYGYIYAMQHNLDQLFIRLTYIHYETKEITYFTQLYTITSLRHFFEETFLILNQFINLHETYLEARDIALESLRFPYQNPRPGQKEMARLVLKTIKDKQTVLIQAPTGIGKTLATLYPSLNALKQHLTSKILYLTAKTITRQVAIDTLNLLNLPLRVLVITAKDKCCFLDESNCHPEHCPYAKGHYNRVNDCLLDVLSNEVFFDSKTIATYAKKHQVCPFELSLDLFYFSDVSISDYNYAFNPSVYLRRAFDVPNDYTLLIDEAHNLVERARTMYSAALNLNQFHDIHEQFKPKKGRLYQRFKKLYEALMIYHQTDPYEITTTIDQLIYECDLFSKATRTILSKMSPSPFKDTMTTLYFDVLRFKRINELYDDQYTIYYKDGSLNLYCINPARNLNLFYHKSQAAILFSATLLPIQHFTQFLTTEPEIKKYAFHSPFPKENKRIFIATDIKTEYRYRNQSEPRIIQYMDILLNTKPGHYLLFFPSYAYMNKCAYQYKQIHPEIEIFLQKPEMSEDERLVFLEAFKTDYHKNKIFFCVLGGIFSEGIDLKGEQVIGVVIVTVGLPQLCFERELIRAHTSYDEAYTYPGFNKVLQAAGRLIRSMDDRGIILLLDERYATKKYLSLLPLDDPHPLPCTLDTLFKLLTSFYAIYVENEN